MLQLRLDLGRQRAATPQAEDDRPQHWQEPECPDLRRPTLALGSASTEDAPILHPVLQSLQSRQLGLRSVVACVRDNARIVSQLPILSFHP